VDLSFGHCATAACGGLVPESPTNSGHSASLRRPAGRKASETTALSSEMAPSRARARAFIQRKHGSSIPPPEEKSGMWVGNFKQGKSSLSEGFCLSLLPDGLSDNGGDNRLPSHEKASRHGFTIPRVGL
jgi:hypothetical protein